MQFYTDKTQCNNKTEVYAFKVGVLNLEYKAKVKYIDTLALLPILDSCPGLSEAQLAEAKRDFMHKAIKTTLTSLQHASYSGFDVSLADGSRHRVYPRALSYVADDPEQHAVLQIKSGVKTKRQCVRCYLTTDLLSAVEQQADMRTLASQQHIRDQILDAATTSQQAAEVVCKEYGTHPEQCGLWGFDGEDNLACE